MSTFQAFSGPESKRRINLGGTPTSSTPTAILSKVQAERSARAALRLRSDSAVRIQAWWRGLRAAREVRRELRAVFERDVLGLDGLRCLVLIGERESEREGEQSVLAVWARAVLALGEDRIFAPVVSEHGQSWLVLIRQASLLLLQSISQSPQSSNALNFLRVLTTLLSADASTKALGPQGPLFTTALTDYLIRHGYYALLGQAIERIPIPSKTSPSLPPLLDLTTLPLSTYPPPSPQHAQIFAQILTSILSIPQLPNRLPLDRLPSFLSRLPFTSLEVLDPLIPQILRGPETGAGKNPGAGGGWSAEGWSAERKVHLAATLYMFVSPHYKRLGAAALGTYLRLSIALFNAFPRSLFSKPHSSKSRKGKAGRAGVNGVSGTSTPVVSYEHEHDEEEDNSDSEIRVVSVSAFASPPPAQQPEPPVKIDDKTLKRLDKLVSAEHLTPLIATSLSKPSQALFADLVRYLFALTVTWPGERAGEILNVVLASGGGGGGAAGGSGLVREIYRSLVRRSALGREENSGAVMDPANYAQWPAILFLCDLYSQALLTMGDDEFFGGDSSSSYSSSSYPSSSYPSSSALSSSSHALNGSGPTNGLNYTLSSGPSSSSSYPSSSYSSSSSFSALTPASRRTSRNPLSLDELVEFSKRLLNIAFTLYWRGGQQQQQQQGEGGYGSGYGSGYGGYGYVSEDVRCSWDVVREKVTRCLVGIHARDSRRPFVPPDHWLITSQLDMQSFVEAAVLEEQQISLDTSSSPSAPSQQPQHRSSSSSQHHPRTRSSRPLISKRQIASLSPRLGILNNIPFAIPFEVRVSIFRHFVLSDMMAHANSSGGGGGFGGGFGGGGFGGVSGFGAGGLEALRRTGFGIGQRARVHVRRGQVAQDGFDKLFEADLKAPVEIAFIDQFGEEEAGIDGGGVFKEFFTSLCKEVFDTDRGLWLATKNNELYPNPHAYATEPHSLNWYRFIGRILGKAMYEGILVDVAFAGFFLAKWLGRQSFLDDLSSLDPDLYNGLIFLKHYTGNVEDLALNFTISIEEFGVTKTIDLIPNGSSIAVTKSNRLTYIYLVAHYRLSKQIKKQSEAFFEGLSEMIDPKWLRMFNTQEVQILIGGVNAPIDLDDLRKHTNYGGLYDDDHETIRMFWKVVNSFDQEQRRALLRFVTSCSRPPLLGFKELVPNFSIRDAGSDQYRLPTSSTCVNLLKLPRYTSEKTLRDKLLQAINSNAGFDLS